MRIVVFTWPVRLQRFLDVIGELSRAGHEVVVASPTTRSAALPPSIAALPGVSVESYEESPDPELGRVKTLIRMAHDYLWHLEPEVRDAAFNRRRSLDFLVRELTRGSAGADPDWPDPVIDLSEAELRELRALLRAAEEKLPPEQHLLELLERIGPDAVLVTPLVLAGSRQMEPLKAAHSLGIPTGFLVFSWDNLTNKGLIHVAPDRVFVWNDVQRREAIELHGVEPASVVVTGAPRWDAFFALSPATTREAFLRHHGLDPAARLVLYLGSTSAVTPDETIVIERWLHTLRETVALRHVNVLVRPHPREELMWSGWYPDHGRVAIDRHPRPADQELYDQLYHADAVVGLNTSAQLEAAILGKPVLTFDAGMLAPGQSGSSHFFYLLSGQGGPVGYAESLSEHALQLERVLAGDYDAAAIESFVRSFIRPHGLDRAASPILARAIERLARGQSEPLA